MARNPDPPDMRLLSKVSKLYYERNLTQGEIADRLLLSRPKVSRLLQQAQREGIVQISVISPSGIYADIEHQIEERFGLQEVVVVDVDETAAQEAASRQIGIAAANYFRRTLNHGDTIGISWGNTLNAMVNALPPCEVQDSHVVQLNGGLGPPEAEVHASDICRRLSRLLNSKLTLIPAPGIASNEQVKAALLSDNFIQQGLETLNHVNVAYIGIGVPSPDSVVMRDGSIITQDELDDLLEKGAVGDIALRFFDAHGQPVASNVDDRVIGITLTQLQQIDRVVGVTGGPQKEAVVRGSLEGQLIDVLITDQMLAARLLE